MTRLHLCFPDHVAERVKARAKAAGKSLSSYLAGLVVRDVDEWPAGFFDEVVGGWKGEALRRPRKGRAGRGERL